MKKLTLILAGFILFAMPQSASAAQCTTGELDLICDDGEFLQGITSLGEKICVPTAETFVDLVCADDEVLQGINVLGEKICRKAGAVAGQLYQCPNIATGRVSSTRSSSTSITDSNCYGQKSVNPSCTYVRKRSGSKGHMRGTSTVTASCPLIK